jgi:hypothetical protein
VLAAVRIPTIPNATNMETGSPPAVAKTAGQIKLDVRPTTQKIHNLHRPRRYSCAQTYKSIRKIGNPKVAPVNIKAGKYNAQSRIDAGRWPGNI